MRHIFIVGLVIEILQQVRKPRCVLIEGLIIEILSQERKLNPTTIKKLGSTIKIRLIFLNCYYQRCFI